MTALAAAEPPDRQALLETVAVLLADPLRRAYRAHLEPELRPCCRHLGMAWCQTHMDLFYLLPDGDQLTILGSIS